MASDGLDRADHVVVGAGVVGLATAWELARRGRRVSVLERARPGSGATAAAGGMLAPISEAEVEPPELVAFGRDSLARYPGFVEALEQRCGRGACGHLAEGTLWVGLDRDDQAEIEHVHARLRALGLEARPVDASTLLTLEPHLSRRVVAGLAVPEDHQVDPRALAACLAADLAARGGRIVCGVHVTEVVERRGAVTGVVGRSATGEPFALETSSVIMAAGAEMARGLSLPWSPPGLRPVKGQLLRLSGPRLLARVVRTPRVYLIPRADGELLVGATVEEMGFDATPTAGAALDLLRHGQEVLPGLYDLALAEVSVGFRPAVDDHLPVIGGCTVRGLFFATGHYRNGVLLAPATAHYLARSIVEGGSPPELAPFAPSRLARSSAAASGSPR